MLFNSKLFDCALSVVFSRDFLSTRAWSSTCFWAILSNYYNSSNNYLNDVFRCFSKTALNEVPISLNYINKKDVLMQFDLIF